MSHHISKLTSEKVHPFELEAVFICLIACHEHLAEGSLRGVTAGDSLTLQLLQLVMIKQMKGKQCLCF